MTEDVPVLNSNDRKELLPVGVYEDHHYCEEAHSHPLYGEVANAPVEADEEGIQMSALIVPKDCLQFIHSALLRIMVLLEDF